jgi:hypothetical protein
VLAFDYYQKDRDGRYNERRDWRCTMRIGRTGVTGRIGGTGVAMRGGGVVIQSGGESVIIGLGGVVIQGDGGGVVIHSGGGGDVKFGGRGVTFCGEFAAGRTLQGGSAVGIFGSAVGFRGSAVIFRSGAAFCVRFSAAELHSGLIFGSEAVFWLEFRRRSFIRDWISVAELFSGLDFGSEAVYLWSVD